MDDAARKYRIRRAWTNMVAIGVLGACGLGARYGIQWYKHSQEVANNHLEAEAVVEALGDPAAIQALDLTPQELKIMADEATQSANTENRPLADGYNSLAWLLRNAIDLVKPETISNPSNLTPATYTLEIGVSLVSITADTVLDPPVPVVADIGHLQVERPKGSQ